MTSEADKRHPCTQEVTLNSICLKLSRIESDIAEIKQFQTLFITRMEAAALNSAHYPKPEKVSDAMTKLDRHDTYFAIMGSGILILWGALLFILNKIWAGLT